MQLTTRPTFLTSSKKELIFLAVIFVLLAVSLTMPFVESLTLGKYNASSVPLGDSGFYKSMLPGYQSGFAWVHIALIIGISVAGNTGRKPVNFILLGMCMVLFLLWYFLLHKLTTTTLDASRPAGVYAIAVCGLLSVVQASVVLFSRQKSRLQ